MPAWTRKFVQRSRAASWRCALMRSPNDAADVEFGAAARNVKHPYKHAMGGTSKTWWQLVFEQIDGAAEGRRKLLGKPCHTSRMGGNNAHPAPAVGAPPPALRRAIASGWPRSAGSRCHNALRAARSPAASPGARRPWSSAATARTRMGMHGPRKGQRLRPEKANFRVADDTGSGTSARFQEASARFQAFTSSTPRPSSARE